MTEHTLTQLKHIRLLFQNTASIKHTAFLIFFLLGGTALCVIPQILTANTANLLVTLTQTKKRFSLLLKEADVKSRPRCHHHSLATLLIMYRKQDKFSCITLLNMDGNPSEELTFNKQNTLYTSLLFFRQILHLSVPLPFCS